MVNKSRWSSGVCLKCNEYFEAITFWHAEKHGFKHPNEMAKKADFILWDKFTVASSRIPRKMKEEYEQAHDVIPQDENHPIMGTRLS